MNSVEVDLCRLHGSWTFVLADRPVKRTVNLQKRKVGAESVKRFVILVNVILSKTVIVRYSHPSERILDNEIIIKGHQCVSRGSIFPAIVHDTYIKVVKFKLDISCAV